MTTLYELLPDAEQLISFEPEDLAGYVLESMNRSHALHPTNFTNEIVQHYPEKHKSQVKYAVMEAWAWLQSESLIAPDPSQSSGFMFITRRGRQLRTHVDVNDLRKRLLIRKDFLHARILQSAYRQFISGQYDGAVFQAFKEVEILVREATGITNVDGVKLMREAFKKGTGGTQGPLTDPNNQESEQEGLQHLFAGAIQWCRNPVGHRNVNLTSAEAAKLLTFASYLLDIVDSRKIVP